LLSGFVNQRLAKMLSVVAEMAPLTERQQTAEALMHELHRLGAFVVNPMPLRSDDKLRFQVLTPAVESVLAKLAEWNLSPVLQSHGLRFTPQGAKPCITYEIRIPADRPVVVDDRTIKGDIATDKAHPEIEAFKKLRLS